MRCLYPSTDRPTGQRLTPATNADQEATGRVSTGPSGHRLLSRTGTMPVGAMMGAHSTHIPPFPSL